MDDLVRFTKVSRHGIYSAFNGKQKLFIACLDAYSKSVVTPAFARVEQAGADLNSVSEFFEQQISLGEASGLPGPGCLMANTMTEAAPHDRFIMRRVARHNARLRRGFLNGLRNSQRRRHSVDEAQLDELALVLQTFAGGLWSFSRTTSSAGDLRAAVRIVLTLVKEKLAQ